MHPNIHRGTIQDMEAIYMSVYGGNDKDDVVHIYNGVLLSHKRAIKPFVATWMDLDTVIWNEVSQAMKGKYYILLMRNLKNMVQMKLFTKQK